MLREDDLTPKRGSLGDALDRDAPDPGYVDASYGSGQSGADHGGDRPSSILDSIDIQRELNRLEELILDSLGIPLVRRRIVDEDVLLDQLDLVRLNLPDAFQTADAITRHKDAILMEAERYAQDLIEAAERQAAQILDESTILRQAQREAQQIRTQLQQECELAKDQTLADIEAMRHQAQQELEDLHYRTVMECEEIQVGADHYAAGVLDDMERRLAEMLRVVRNGRQQLGDSDANPPAALGRDGLGREVSGPGRGSGNRSGSNNRMESR